MPPMRSLILLAILAVPILQACVPRAEASSTDRVAVEVSGNVATIASLGIPDSYTVSVRPTQTLIQAPYGQGSYRCQNNSASIVYVGDSTVTSSTGSPYCTTAASCPDGAAWGGDFAYEYAILADAGRLPDGGFIDGGAQVPTRFADGGFVTLRCRSGK